MKSILDPLFRYTTQHFYSGAKRKALAKASLPPGCPPAATQRQSGIVDGQTGVVVSPSGTQATLGDGGQRVRTVAGHERVPTDGVGRGGVLGGGLETVRRKEAILRQHCEAVGRDFGTLELSLQDLVVIAPTDAALGQAGGDVPTDCDVLLLAVSETEGRVLDRVADALAWAREILERYEGDGAPPTTLTAPTL